MKRKELYIPEKSCDILGLEYYNDEIKSVKRKGSEIKEALLANYLEIDSRECYAFLQDSCTYELTNQRRKSCGWFFCSAI